MQPSRYDNMEYKKCGRSGLFLSKLSLGIWHNFGPHYPHENQREMVLRAFELGITHIDAANNYGPPPGAAEVALGRILREDLSAHRDELIITSKAGYEMWDGPYGNWGSRKSILASCEQSLQRLGLEYVDIFYHHRPDPDTPLEETMGALRDLVRQGKALYVGVSNYSPEDTQKAAEILRNMGVPLLIHQHRYNMISRQPEEKLYCVLKQEGIGSIAFCPLEQGLLTGKYLGGIPKDSRVADANSIFLTENDLTKKRLAMLRQLDAVAKERGQTLAQLALAWAVREGGADFAIIGASRSAQIEENVKTLQQPALTGEELARIDAILAEAL